MMQRGSRSADRPPAALSPRAPHGGRPDRGAGTGMIRAGSGLSSGNSRPRDCRTGAARAPPPCAGCTFRVEPFRPAPYPARSGIRDRETGAARLPAMLRTASAPGATSKVGPFRCGSSLGEKPQGTAEPARREGTRQPAPGATLRVGPHRDASPAGRPAGGTGPEEAVRAAPRSGPLRPRIAQPHAKPGGGCPGTASAAPNDVREAGLALAATWAPDGPGASSRVQPGLILAVWSAQPLEPRGRAKPGRIDPPARPDRYPQAGITGSRAPAAAPATRPSRHPPGTARD